MMIDPRGYFEEDGQLILTQFFSSKMNFKIKVYTEKLFLILNKNFINVRYLKFKRKL